MWQRLKNHFLQQHPQANGKWQWLNEKLREAELNRFDHNTVAKGVALGLFIAFLPLPGQMPIAGILAYSLRANIYLAVMMTWISNPFTFVPINFAIYKIGQWLTNNHTPYHPLISFDWKGSSLSAICNHLIQWLGSMGMPFLIGTLAVASGTAVLSYLIIHLCAKIMRWWQP